jgi:predicted RNA-binding Zn-ribbon protein involved in translation (DUF1610 family)
MNNSPCPVCRLTLSAPTLAPHTRTFTFNCPRCGSYLVGDQALRLLQDELGRQRLRWAITSHAVNAMWLLTCPRKPISVSPTKGRVRDA